jgi:DMSO/TMAO reductase YedYZ molybdopterin-dependent catalytic subunit
VQWGAGAVAEARWTGTRLDELLLAARPSEQACEVVFEGADRGKHHTCEDSISFARSIPLTRALTGDVLIAWAMNGRPIPRRHGAPMRVIVPGVYAVASVKWLRRIEVLEQPFDGPFQIEDYRMFEPGGSPSGESLQELKVNALIVSPGVGELVRGSTIAVAGVAWGGRGVAGVEVRLAGDEWRPALLARQNSPYGLAHWRCVMMGVLPGTYTIEVRAHDEDGLTQPKKARWNALGYANNSRHRVGVTVVAI